MNENVLKQTIITEENYLLEENSLYTPTDGPQIQVLQTMAAASSLREIDSNPGSLADLTFPIHHDESLFLGNGMVVRATIPIKMVMSKPPPNIKDSAGNDVEMPITSENYVHGVLNNYADFSLKQYGLLNMLDMVTATVNGTQLSSVSRIAEQASIIFPYYSEKQVDDFFEASIPDRFQKYETYDGLTNGVKSIQPFGTRAPAYVSVPKGEHDENIFRSGYNKSYNTRKPVIEFSGYNAQTKTFRGVITLETFLPFSIFGLSDSDTAYWGIKTLILNIKMKSVPTHHLFSMKKDSGGVYPIKSIDFDDDQKSLMKSTLFYRVFSAPSFIEKGLRMPNTNAIKPYRLSTTATQFNTVHNTIIGAHQTKTVHVMETNISAIPKSIYVAAIRSREGSFEKLSTTPNVFGRIEKINIHYDNFQTDYNNSSACLYSICKGNGLTTDKESALYTCGFPVKFDFTSDITGGGGNSFVGKLKATNVRISMDITNLDAEEDHDYEIITIIVYDSFIQYRDGFFNIIKALVADVEFDISNFARDFANARMRKSNIVGGSFFKNLWNKVQSGAKSAVKFYDDNKATIDTVTGIVRKFLGAGDQLHRISGGVYNNITGGASINGSNMLGAGKMTKNALAGKNVSSVNFL